MTAAASAASGSIRIGALGSGIALAVLAGVVFLWKSGRLPVRVALLLIPLTVGADLWRNARVFWRFSEPQSGLYGGDQITSYLEEQELPFRVLDLTDTGVEVYRGSSLMAYGVPQLLGHHGNQLDWFNQLMGGKNQWRYLFASRRLWDLFAVQYVLLPSGVDLGAQLPAFRGFTDAYRPLLADVPTASGEAATMYERNEPARYARFVPGAVKVPDDQAVPTVADPRSSLPFDQVVLLDTAAAVNPQPLDSLPAPVDVALQFASWEPGRMSLLLQPAAPRDGYVVVAENYYPDWRATVDGADATVVRGNVSLITVPVSAGAREVELEFRSDAYRTGRMLTLLSLILVAAAVVVPPVLRRRGG